MCQQTIAIRQNSSNRNATSKILGQPNAHPWLGQRTKSFYSANPEIFGQPTIFSASLQDPLPANHSAKFQHVQANEFDLPTSKILAQPNVNHWPASESANPEDPCPANKLHFRRHFLDPQLANDLQR
jgi:hypothetical protein